MNRGNSEGTAFTQNLNWSTCDCFFNGLIPHKDTYLDTIDLALMVTAKSWHCK